MIRVIQWGTGVTGKKVALALHKHKDFEIVGCYTTSAGKDGRDLGEICGVADFGVKATTDQDAIVALKADCVLYMTLEEFGLDKPVGEICKLLESGKNVISSASTVLLYPKAAGGDVAARIEAACQKGGTTFHGTGIEPGWASDVLSLTMSGVLGRVDTLVAQEIIDYASYNSPQSMFELMSFGKAPTPVPPTALPPDQAGAFGAPLMMIADALGAKIDSIILALEPAVAEVGYDVAAGRIEAGTMCGKRMSFTAMIEGKPKLKIEHITRMGEHVRPDWPTGKGWYVTVQGNPSMRLSVEIGIDGSDQNDQATLATAMHVVHSIKMICAARPGISTFLDLPMITGPGILSGDGVAAG